MFFRLLLLFTLVPMLELALLIKVGEWIGFWPTIGIIVTTGVVGSILARRAGGLVWRRLQQRLQAGGLPGDELMDGAIVLMSGALLVTPGVLTDLTGFLGLLPLSRTWIKRGLTRWFKRYLSQGHVSMYVDGRRMDTPPGAARPPDPPRRNEIEGEWTSA